MGTYTEECPSCRVLFSAEHVYAGQCAEVLKVLKRIMQCVPCLQPALHLEIVLLFLLFLSCTAGFVFGELSMS
jgi:hypothetical protein